MVCDQRELNSKLFITYMVEKKTRQPRPRRMEREREEFEQRIIDLARVTRVMAGGKRMRFRACVVIGDRRGRVAMGV
ncbi:MAG TPA: hypothetical protein VJA22_01140, partial [Patescibacteria group bacterium]|nr:hypothetical protein [Patescibacteria group bacterium]